MNNEILKMSETGHREYCATVIKIDNLEPIENSDHLATIDVNGFKTVVDKRVTHIGDIMIYISNECEINSSFLSSNNMYNFFNSQMNANSNDIEKLINDGKVEEAKTLCGFFEKTGRVRTIKLRGVQSFGILISPSSLINWKPDVANVKFDDVIGLDFDTVCDETFVKAYVPRTSMKTTVHSGKIYTKKEDRLDKLIPGEFAFHYDTQLMAKNMDRFTPDTNVSISVKMDGTSFIFANVKCVLPLKIPFFKRLWNKIIPKKFTKLRFIDTYIGYDELYSSRKVLKNGYTYNGKEKAYTDDEYGYFAKRLHGKIPEGVTIYGEIVGFKPNSNKFIAKNYDYGCKPGDLKLMIYRVKVEDFRGKIHECNIDEVKNFTDMIKKENTDISDLLIDIPILYIGPLNNLLKLKVDDNWQKNALQKLASMKEFHMEENEPMCNNKVPREGIVVRIMDDPTAEAFKIKCVKYCTREAKEIDAGNISTEMEEEDW